MSSGGPEGTAAVDLSVLIPVFNEEENLPSVGEELAAVLPSLGLSCEVIFIDDGSTDRSFEIIRGLAAANKTFRAVRLGRNAGQTAAMAAGIRHARGELIALLDSDLQNDPRDLPRLIEKLGEGLDVVSGWRRDRHDAYVTRRIPSQAANAIISWVTGVPLHDYGCTLKLYRSRFIKPLRLYGEMHRFVPALAGFLGARVGEIEVRHRPRTRGVSKYGLSRTYKVILDLLTVKFMDSYMGKPIYLFGGWGLLFASGGAAAAGMALYKKLFLGVFIKDQPLFQVSIFLALIGLQMILLGLLAEILVRVHLELQERTSYFVRETIGIS